MTYDLIVIGAGPGGEKGAAQAAYFGKRVALVEMAPVMGGACVNTGTVPSKTLRETALFYDGVQQRELWGLKPQEHPETMTVEGLMSRKDRVVGALQEQIRINMEDRHGVDTFHGTGSLLSPGKVLVRGADGRETTLEGKVVLLATGSRPFRPDLYPWDCGRVFDSDTILKMPFLPASLTVVGGGVIACEYACIFAALGVNVTLLERGERLVPFVDTELGEVLQERMTSSLGITLKFAENVESCLSEGDTVTVRLASGQTLQSEALLFAAGRVGNADSLNLEAVGLEADKRGRVSVDENYATGVDGLYAVGDLIGFPALASTSMEQGRVAVCRAFDFEYKNTLPELLPFCIYTIPELSSVGLSEQQCKERNIPYLVGRTRFAKNPRGLIVGDEQGFLKLVFHAEDKTLLGVHIMGVAAAETIHLASCVLHHKGTIDYFIDAVFNYPTLSDAYKYAAYDGLGAFARHRQG